MLQSQKTMLATGGGPKIVTDSRKEGYENILNAIMILRHVMQIHNRTCANFRPTGGTVDRDLLFFAFPIKFWTKQMN